MQVTVKLYATLARHLPSGARDNQAVLDLPEGATPASIIEMLNMAAAHCHLVLINGAYVAPSERASRALKPGDTLAMWPPVAGG